MRWRSFFAAAGFVFLLVGCATTAPSESVRLTANEEEVASCDRLGEVSVPTQYERNRNNEQTLSGTDTLDKAWTMDYRTATTLRHWAAKKGADTVLVVSFKDGATRGVACHCGRS